MKVAFVSDLHLEFRAGVAAPGAEEFALFGSVCFPRQLDADVLVLAGDIHPDAAVRDEVYDRLAAAYGIPVVPVNGNHDYYGGPFPVAATGDLYMIGGRRFACATLWTQLGPMEEVMASRYADFAHMTDITAARWNYAHQEQARFLRQSEAEVIVTHFAPTWQSVAPRFGGNALNRFFVSNLDMGLFPRCKLFIHGHTHDDLDYEIDGIRVCCNPWGYPFERRPLKIKTVDID